MDERDARDLLARTKAFALRIVRLYSSLPKTTEAQVLGKQVLRSGTLCWCPLPRSNAREIKSRVR